MKRFVVHVAPHRTTMKRRVEINGTFRIGFCEGTRKSEPVSNTNFSSSTKYVHGFILTNARCDISGEKPMNERKRFLSKFVFSLIFITLRIRTATNPNAKAEQKNCVREEKIIQNRLYSSE